MTPERFVIENLFRIVDKRQVECDFILNEAQRYLDDNYHPRMVVPKARQEGVSSYFLALNTVRCLGVRNTRAVVISHDIPSTEKMLSRVRFFLETFKGPKPVIKNDNRNELTFPKTNSMFYIGTAGQRKFGRGDTITDLLCSEVAYWPEPKKLMAGLLQAVPKDTGRVYIESTGSGAGTWFHNLCMRAARGQSSFKLIFLPWHTFSEYRVPLSEEEKRAVMASLRADLEEPEVCKAYGLTPEQIVWRRRVIEDECEGDLALWRQEYPSCLDDCFQLAKTGVFHQVNYQETPNWRQVDNNFFSLDGHPMRGRRYVIGADVAAGVGRDSSVAEIFCLDTEEQVGEWISNRVSPEVFAHHLSDLGHLFNDAYIGVESNNHGILTLSELLNSGYPRNLIHRTPSQRRGSSVDLGVRTTVRSKPILIGLLRKKLSTSAIVHSPVLRNELSTFIEHEDGSLGAADGCFDDCVIAAAIAFFVQGRASLSLSPAPPPRTEEVDPFSLDAIIQEREKARAFSFFPPHISGVV